MTMLGKKREITLGYPGHVYTNTEHTFATGHLTKQPT